MTRCHKKGELTRGSSSLLLFLMFLMKTRLFFSEKNKQQTFRENVCPGPKAIECWKQGEICIIHGLNVKKRKSTIQATFLDKEV